MTGDPNTEELTDSGFCSTSKAEGHMRRPPTEAVECSGYICDVRASPAICLSRMRSRETTMPPRLKTGHGMRVFCNQSGLCALLMTADLCVAAVASGAMACWIGHYVQYMYLSTNLSSIAAGLPGTIDVKLDIAKLLGFQMHFGLCRRQTTVQVFFATHEASVGLAIVQYESQIRPVLCLAGLTALFFNRFKIKISQYSPATIVFDMMNFVMRCWATILRLYTNVQTLFLLLALSRITIFGSLGMD